MKNKKNIPKKDNSRLSIRTLGKLFKTAFLGWWNKDPFRQSAVIAYYAIFSIPGLLFLIIAFTGNIFGKEAVIHNIITQVNVTMGSDTGSQIENMLAKIAQPHLTAIGSIIGLVVLFFGATGVFVELQKTLNIIWEVKVVPKSGIISFLKSRIFSFGLILAIAFLLLISLVISAALAAMSDWIQAYSSGFTIIIFNTLNIIFSFAFISVLFALMFKFMPDAKIKWKHVWIGSIVAGALFTLGKTALAFYFGKAQPASVYGVAGSIILIMLWVSYSSMIVFFGAELTATYAKLFTAKVLPTNIAVATNSEGENKK